jgi:hypothetical protein
MSEWTSVVAVFWVLWAVDGARFGPRRIFTIVGNWRGRRGRIGYSRLSLPGVSPGSWRFAVSDVPLSISPRGLCNVPVGSSGRPAESPSIVQAWRWDEVREVGVANGSIYVNGARFCADTGHVSARQLLALAGLEPAARTRRIEAIIRGWFRMTHLRRRGRVLTARTFTPALLNAMVVVVVATLSVYVVGDFSERLAPRASHLIAQALPGVIGGTFTLHLAAVIVSWRTLRRLRPVGPQKRGGALFSALLLPPQGLRLRALLGDGFFPAQHPLAGVVAFGSQRACEEHAFHTLADLRWPVALPEDETQIVRDVIAWFRDALEPEVVRAFKTRGLAVKTLLAPPARDLPTSCSYCPRCRDQFVAGPQMCPHGVTLQTLADRRKL